MEDKICNGFCWSDNWWIEDNNAWFVDGERDVLLKLNFLTNQCEFIKKIPNDEKKTFRQNPRCIKYHNDIVCLTDIFCEEMKKISILHTFTVFYLHATKLSTDYILFG